MTGRCPDCGVAVAVVVVLGEDAQPLCDDCRGLDDAKDRARFVDGLLAAAGATGPARVWSLASFPGDPAALASVTAWLERADRGNLILTGPIGVGKTGLAWSAVRALCESGTGALLLNFRDYLWAVRQAFRTGEAASSRPHSVRVLALDDLGAERPTDFAREELATLIEHRAAEGLATVVTSNYEPAELVSRLGHDDPVVGQRIVSRLVQDAVQVRVGGADRRLG